MDVLPPQQRIDEHWYRGTADAIYQNIYSLERERACICSSSPVITSAMDCRR
ncbi:MAG: hypothetical protein U0798_19765 [Gemmataceae bacterium]